MLFFKIQDYLKKEGMGIINRRKRWIRIIVVTIMMAVVMVVVMIAYAMIAVLIMVTYGCALFVRTRNG